jgi:hypothetical protein
LAKTSGPALSTTPGAGMRGIDCASTKPKNMSVVRIAILNMGYSFKLDERADEFQVYSQTGCNCQSLATISREAVSCLVLNEENFYSDTMLNVFKLAMCGGLALALIGGKSWAQSTDVTQVQTSRLIRLAEKSAVDPDGWATDLLDV